MQIANILTVPCVALDVAAASKKGVLEELARLAAGDNADLTPAQGFDALVVRERLGSTGLGSGVAIPHGRINHLKAMQGAFMRTAAPVDFDAIDGEPVDLFFALFVPQDTTDEHLEMLSRLATCFSDDGFLQQLRDVDTKESVHRLLVGSSG